MAAKKLSITMTQDKTANIIAVLSFSFLLSLIAYLVIKASVVINESECSVYASCMFGGVVGAIVYYLAKNESKS